MQTTLIAVVLSVLVAGGQGANKYLPHANLARWIYNSGSAVPGGFKVLNKDTRQDGPSWALVQDPANTANCVLVHRGTAIPFDVWVDMKAGTRQAIIPKSELNTTAGGNLAFWSKYNVTKPVQDQALSDALAKKQCTNLDVTGHSLGGATAALAAVAIGMNDALNTQLGNVVLFAGPKVWQTRILTFECKDILNYGNIVRFARFDLTPDPEKSRAFDVIPSGPGFWANCVHESYALKSDMNATTGFAIQDVKPNLPSFKVVSVDIIPKEGLKKFAAVSTQWHSMEFYSKILSNVN